MKYLLFLSLFLISCIEAPVTELFSEEGRDQLRSRVRSRSLNDSSARCAEHSKCKRTCEDMYLRATDLDRCYNASENRVNAISKVFDVLINPSRLSRLNDIEPTDFSHFLNIGWRGFLDLIDPVHRDEDGDRRGDYWGDIHAYDPQTAQLVLEWIANEEQTARSVSSKDKDLEIARHLFCIAGRSVAPSNQKQYLCDLWNISNCASVTDGELEDELGFINWSDYKKRSSKHTTSCHDHPTSLYIGLTQGDYDDVAFSTYAEAQENDQAVNLAEDLIADLCADTSNDAEALICVYAYACPVQNKYEGGVEQLCLLPYASIKSSLED